MNAYKTESEVFVFHDETGKAGDEKLKGHILLFVPVKLRIILSNTLWGDKIIELNPLEKLYIEINKLRKRFNVNHKFHFKEISGRKWNKANEAEKQLIIIGVDALRYRGTKIFRNPLCCKIAIIFFPNPNLDSLIFYGGKEKDEKKLRFNETVLRMLLKGAIHYLYTKDHKVKILKILSDGQPYHRKLSEERVLWRLIEEQLVGDLREYVDISPNVEIIHLDSNHRKYGVGSNEYIYANMLQLADMFLGSVIQSCLKGIKWQNISPQIRDKVEDKKSIIAYPVKEMLDKRKRGRNFEYSGHYKSFTISKAYIKDGKWEFENIMSQEIKINMSTGQITLFDL